MGKTLLLDTTLDPGLDPHFDLTAQGEQEKQLLPRRRCCLMQEQRLAAQEKPGDCS